MSGSHGGQLYIGRSSPVHALAPQVKIAAAVLATFAVVATPRTAVWAFAVQAAIVLGVVLLARLPVRSVLRRMVIEVPFLVGAALLPVISRGPRVDVGPLSLSESGLWSAWNLLAKGTLGASIAVVLVSTTQVPDLLGGLARLRVPRLMVGIAGFTVRYVEVLADDVQRMRIARIARGDDPRWIWQARSVAVGAGTLFVRAYERGERVHLAMLARGHDSTTAMFDAGPARGHDVLIAAAAPVATWLVVAAAWWSR